MEPMTAYDRRIVHSVLGECLDIKTESVGDGFERRVVHKTNMLEIKLLPNAEVEIIGEISTEIFMSGRNEAMKEFSEEVELKGFRKGKIPEKHTNNSFRQYGYFGKKWQLSRWKKLIQK